VLPAAPLAKVIVGPFAAAAGTVPPSTFGAKPFPAGGPGGGRPWAVWMRRALPSKITETGGLRGAAAKINQQAPGAV